MTTVRCPHCRKWLEVDPSLAGQVVTCAHCSGAMTVPEITTEESPETEGMPGDVLFLVLAAVHFCAAMSLGLVIGLGFSVTVVALIVVIEVAVWKREKINSLFERDWEVGTASVFVEKARTRTRPFDLDVPQDGAGTIQPQEGSGLVTAKAVDECPVEIQVSIPSRRSRRTVVPPRRTPFRTGIVGNPPRDRVAFFGPGTQLELGRGTAENPLVYATCQDTQDTFDVSLIDCTLPVAAAGVVPTEGLPYWPSYNDPAPHQRSGLIGGRFHIVGARFSIHLPTV